MEATTNLCTRTIGWRSIMLGLLIGLFSYGCSFAGLRAKLVATTSDQKDAIGIAGERLSELDQATYSFADRYVTVLSDACDKATQGNPNHGAAREALRIKLHNASSAYAIVTGPNPLGQLLDLATVVTLNKIDYVDEGKAVKEFGDRHGVIETAFNNAYDDIWEVAGRFLKANEIQSVKQLISAWRQHHKDIGMLAYVRFDDFSRARAGLEQETPEIGGLFDRISEVKQTVQTAQQFGERTFFYMQRLPRLLQWQTERTAQGILDNDDMETLQASVQQVSNAATTFAQEIKHFDQRQAGVQESLARVSGIVEQIDKLAPNIQGVLQDGQKLLLAAHETSTALGGTLASADKLSAQFVKAPGTPEPVNAKPFDINEYGRTLAELSSSLQHAQALLQTLQAPELSQRLAEIQQLVDDRIDHTVWRLAQLLILVFVLAALYRVLPGFVARS